MTIDALLIRLPNKRLERTSEGAAAQPQSVNSYSGESNSATY